MLTLQKKNIFFFKNIPGEVFRRNHVPKLKEKEETRLKMKKSKKNRPAKYFRSENDLTMSFYTIQMKFVIITLATLF